MGTYANPKSRSVVHVLTRKKYICVCKMCAKIGSQTQLGIASAKSIVGVSKKLLNVNIVLIRFFVAWDLPVRTCMGNWTCGLLPNNRRDSECVVRRRITRTPVG